MRRLLSLLKGLLLGVWAIAPRPALASGTTRAVVLVYDGWGDQSGFIVSGRVLEDPDARAPLPHASEAHNLVENLKALESDELAGVELRVAVGGASYTATTDQDGVFRVEVKGLNGAHALRPGRLSVTAEAVAPARVQARPGAGSVFVHDSGAPFVALLSDIDDTVVQTHVTDKKAMFKTVLLKNSAQLDAVVGAAANYQDAQRAGVAAFFYLSGSPQNLHARLRGFLEQHTFPPGPLLLKNLGEDSLLQQQGYKAARIDMLMERFPAMRVILVGDSGEKDPEIYRAARERFGARVLGIVIRKAPGGADGVGRFTDCVVVDGEYARDDVISALLKAGTPPAGKKP